MSGPRIYTPRPREDPLAEREIEAIVAVLREHGPLGVRELRARTEARFWGPGRFGAALARARRTGRVRRVGVRRYAAV